MSLSRLDELFHAARALPATDWAGYLARECGGDWELEATLLGMLQSEGEAYAWFVKAEESLGLFWEEAVPERVGPYRVLRRLGSGGMGTVDLAEGLGQTVAVKCMLGDGPELLKQFLDERQSLSRLDHPGIAGFLDGGRTALGEPYLVMEYVEGIPLAEWERREPILAARVKLLREVAEAVEYAHERQVVHGDLKPNNVLVTMSGQPKLLDFGIARLMDRQGSGQPIALTPAYAAPELIAGGSVSPLTDVYGLGALLRELIQEGADAWLAAILLRAVRPEPTERYQSVGAMLGDLRAWEQGKRTLATA